MLNIRFYISMHFSNLGVTEGRTLQTVQTRGLVAFWVLFPSFLPILFVVFFSKKLSHKFFYVFDSFPYVCHRCVPSCPILSVLKQESDLSEFEHPTDYPDLSWQLPGGGTLDTSAIEETAFGIWNNFRRQGCKWCKEARRRDSPHFTAFERLLANYSQTIEQS